MKFGLLLPPLAVACGALLTGCGSSSAKDAHAGAAGTVSSSISSVTAGPTLASSPATASATGAATSPAGGVRSTPASVAISIPPYLCDATDVAQNAADAYMGSLSAGDEKQANACVLPGAVPAETTRSLLATTKGTAVYLPRDGVDGPTVFGYRGNGRSVDVTVTKEPDGKFWITKVTVHSG